MVLPVVSLLLLWVVPVQKWNKVTQCRLSGDDVNLELGADDVRRAGALGGLFDVEVDLGSFRQIFTANVLHVEENVVVRVVRRDETVAASVVEEINLTVCHCNYTQVHHTVKTCVFVFLSGRILNKHPNKTR